MELSIIILNYKTRGLLRQCLRGILRFPPSVQFEIIVVDNGSGDGTPAMMAEEFPHITFVALPKNIGYAAGSNVGIRVAQGRFLLFLNADVVVLERSIEALYRFMESNPRVGVAGPCLKNPDGAIQESAYAFHATMTPLFQRTFLGRTAWGRREVDRFLLRDWDHKTTRDVDWLMSSCFLVRRAALDEIGVFDERFFVYLADTDLCRRFHQKRWRVTYAPEAVFVHYHRRQSADDWRVAVVHIKDWLRYLWKWRGQPVIL